jgi:hypothetical protein
MVTSDQTDYRHQYYVERGDAGGPRIPIYATAQEAASLTKSLSKSWRDRATLIHPSTGRVLLTVEAQEAA